MKNVPVPIDYVLEIDVPDASIVERHERAACASGIGPHLSRQVQSGRKSPAATT